MFSTQNQRFLGKRLKLKRETIFGPRRFSLSTYCTIRTLISVYFGSVPQQNCHAKSVKFLCLTLSDFKWSHPHLFIAIAIALAALASAFLPATLVAIAITITLLIAVAVTRHSCRRLPSPSPCRHHHLCRPPPSLPSPFPTLPMLPPLAIFIVVAVARPLCRRRHNSCRSRHHPLKTMTLYVNLLNSSAFGRTANFLAGGV